MKIFVTKEYFEKAIAKVKKIEVELDDIRKEKGGAFQGDTNTWHDNFAYESLTREEKMTENKFFKAAKDLDDLVVFEKYSMTSPQFVEIYCLVKVLEENLATLKKIEKTIGLVPLGAEDYKKFIYSYNAPVVSPLMGAKVGEERIIKIPIGSFKLKVLDIQRMVSK